MNCNIQREREGRDKSHKIKTGTIRIVVSQCWVFSREENQSTRRKTLKARRTNNKHNLHNLFCDNGLE